MYKKFKTLFIIILFVLLSINIYAQREANIWYFGQYAGLDFNSGIPIPLTDGVLHRWEGVATFSDSFGSLLFYTDGETVWNAEHLVMPNGSGLLGHRSSTESAIIIPYPEHDSLYYIFTVDYEGKTNGLCYSMVNMNLDNGLGDITEEKNIQLITPVSEKVTALNHENNDDYWVISHGWETDSFLVYSVTATGLNTTPQIHEIGTSHDDIGLHGNNAVGYMRAAPTGDKIALVLQVERVFEVFDFDNSTGEISNCITIPDTADAPYGVEFSPDASKLYLTSRFYLHQIDLNAGSPEEIIDSYTLVDSSQTQNFFAALQLGTDGKIYLAHDFSNYLGVINYPSETPENCGFVLDGLYLEGRLSRMGLPNFIQSFFLPPDFYIENFCFRDSTEFIIQDITGIDSVFWDFDDPIVGTENYSKLFSPKHKFSAPGIYDVHLTMYRLNVAYEKNKLIQINAPQNIELGNDTIICIGDTIFLNAYAKNLTYLWNDLSTDSVLMVNTAGTYWLAYTDIYTQCSNSDTISVLIDSLPDFSLGNDTSFCPNDSLILNIDFPNATFLWSNDSINSEITLFNSGIYWLEVTDSIACKNRDSINIGYKQIPEFTLGDDTVICENTSILLNINKEGEFVWNDNSTVPTLIVTEPGIYWLLFADSTTCHNSDTIIITRKYKPEFNLGNDTLLCEGTDLFLNISLYDVSYLWQDETEESEFVITEKGIYWCEVTNICGSSLDSISITYEYCGDVFIPNIFTPNADGNNDSFIIKGIEDEVWELKIYDRWGKLLFESQDYKNNWDGAKQPDGVYYYILSSREFNMEYTGFVHKYGK